jgi:hypothetical protein
MLKGGWYENSASDLTLGYQHVNASLFSITLKAYPSMVEIEYWYRYSSAAFSLIRAKVLERIEIKIVTYNAQVSTISDRDTTEHLPTACLRAQQR